ncbi:MAG: efflux RND transporter periplasmic adaptor subunit [Prolixibacteraceae bacterium]
MKRRKIIITATGGIILGGAIFLASRLSSPSSEGPAAGMPSAATNAAVVVDARKIKNSTIETYVNITGRLQPENKIDIFAEVNGVLETPGKPFKTGVYFSEGEVLLQMNDDEARQNLLAQKNSFINVLAKVVPDLKIDYPEIYEPWRSYLLKVNIEEPLPPLPQVQTEQQKLFLTGRNIYTQYHSIQQLENRLGKYTIRAPFSGVITEANITEGTLVRSMQKLGEFMRTGVFELEASVGINELVYIDVGNEVDLTSTTTAGNKKYRGVISRINAKVDQQTQTIKIFIRVWGSDLKAGMYMSGRVLAEVYEEAIEIPRESILQDSHIFVVEDSTARLRGVEIKKLAEKKAVVQGVPDGTLIITEERNKSFEGTKVTTKETGN